MSSFFTGPITTTRVVSIHLKKETNLLDFALSRKNCKINHNNLWRCTHYSKNYSINIYSSGKNILFTKVLNDKEIYNEMTKLFNGNIPYKIELRNWSVKFKFHQYLNLDSLNRDLKNSDLNRIFNIIYQEKVMKCSDSNTYPKETVQMNKQAFTAIILRPFKGTNVSNITFTIFATGAIGVTGLKSVNDIEIVKEYLFISLIKKLNDNVADTLIKEEHIELFSF